MKVSFAACLLLLALFIPLPREAKAQVVANGPVISWSTNTYVPPGFTGKRLPTAGSDITAWIIVLQDGSPVDISGDLVQWYANSQVIQSGTGLQKISFQAQKALNQIVNLQARVQGANGEILIGNIQIPIVSPKVVVDAAYPGGVVTTPTITARALPYFFNVTDSTDLTFTWLANGTQAQGAENPDTLAVDASGVSSGTQIRLNLTVVNSTDSTAAMGSAIFTYQKI